MTITIRTSARQKLLEVPAIRSRQGGRNVYTFTLTCGEVDSKLAVRTDPEVIREANRRYDAKHARTIQHYLNDKSQWVLGALLLAIDDECVEFDPYPDEHGNPSPVGNLVIYEDANPRVRLFDGQHRRGAMSDLIKQDFIGGLELLERGLADIREEYSSNTGDENLERAISAKELEIAQLQGKFDEFMSESLTVILYGEGNLEGVRQMFSDAAKAKVQEPNTRAIFDRQDPFNVAANQIMQDSELLRSRVELERSAVSQTSTRLISINQLATALKTLQFGYYGRASRGKNAQLLNDPAPIVNAGSEFFDEFLPAAVEEFDRLLNGELATEDIPDERMVSFAFNFTVIRVLAGCYHFWYSDNGDWRKLADFLRAQRFDKGRQRGAILVQSGLVAPGGNTPNARRQEVNGAIRYILEAARKHRDQSL